MRTIMIIAAILFSIYVGTLATHAEPTQDGYGYGFTSTQE